jgi:hypothetical protein
MSLIGFLLALVVAGVGFVSGFQGAIRSVLRLAPAKHRAGVLSVIYMVSYLALSLPAIIARVVVVGTGSLELTARACGIAVFALAALAFAVSLDAAKLKPPQRLLLKCGRSRLPRAARVWAEAAAIHCLILVS